MAQFNLLDITAKKDPITGKVAFKETLSFKIGMSIAAGSILTLLVLEQLDFDLPDWTDVILGSGMVIAYFFAFIAFFFSRNAGKVSLKKDTVIISPKKNADNFPASPVNLDTKSEIEINIIQFFRFMMFVRILIHVSIKKNGTESEIGVILRNKKKQKQYLAVLDSWYRAGYRVKEFDQLGSRVFKLEQGKTYANIQKIKEEYGINWK